MTNLAGSMPAFCTVSPVVYLHLWWIPALPLAHANQLPLVTLSWFVSSVIKG